MVFQKDRFILVFLISFLFSFSAFSQAFQWAIQSGGAGTSSTSDRGEGVATDPFGNVYMTGIFEGTANFDTVSLTSSGNLDIFIEKRNAQGEFQWVVKAGGPLMDKPNAICTDSLGNVYITGQFGGTATFDTQSITANGIDIFVAKYDSSGVLQWVISQGGSSVNRGLGIAADGNGNVIVVGDFGGTATFGTSTNMTAAGAVDVFVAKYNTSGNLIWARRAGGNVNDRATCVTTDSDGNIYIAGSFGGTANFQGTNISAVGGTHDTDIFTAKYTAAGNLAWVRAAGAPGGNVEEAKGISLDANGNVYVCGVLLGSASFDGIIVNSYGSYDAFVAKYNNNGIIQWAKTLGGTSSDEATGINVRPDGKINVVGYFIGNINIGNYTLNAFSGASDMDGFVAQLDTAGNVLWARRMGRVNEDRPLGIASDSLGNLYITGYFRTNILFDHIQLNSQGSSDAFLAQINDFIILDTLPSHHICAGDSIHLPFSAAPVFNAGNVFSLQLSNATGSFASPTTIGTLNAYTSDTISALIPHSITQGTNYRLRIISSDIETQSHVYAMPIQINEAPAMPQLSTPLSLCHGDSLASIEVSGQNVLWYSDAALTNFIDSGNVIVLNETFYSDTLFYAVDVSLDNCTSAVANINVPVYDLPDIIYNAPDTLTLCDNEAAFVIDIFPAGGAFSGVGVILPDTFSPVLAGEGFHEIIYSYTDTNFCTSQKSLYFDVLPAPDVSIDTTPQVMVFYDDTLFLSGSPAGGIFFGDGVTDNYYYDPTSICNPCEVFYAYTAPNGCADTASILVYTIINNTENLQKEGWFSVYPNPFHESFYINTTTQGVFTLKMFDILGRRLIQKQITGETYTQINTRELLPGVYVLLIYDKNEIVFSTILKKQ